MKNWLIWIFLWYSKISSLPKLYYRMHNRKGVRVKECRTLENAGRSVVKCALDTIYWERCLDLNLCPSFLKFRPPKLKQYQNVDTIYKQVVQESYNISKAELEKKEIIFQTLKQELVKKISWLDKTTLMCLLNRSYRRYAEKVKLTHNSKLLNMWQKQRPKSPDCIRNISSKKLTLEEQHVLYRGLKHNIMPKNVPAQQLKADIEKCVNSAVLCVVRDKMQETTIMQRKTQAVKNAAFNDSVNNVTQSVCNVAFRDNIKFAFKAFIGTAKAICNTRSTRAFHKTLSALASNTEIKVCSFDKGVGLVVLDTDKYYDKLDTIINDTSKFTQIEYNDASKHPILKEETSIQNYLRRYFKKDMDSQLYSKVYPVGSNPGKLYGMCKVHKQNYPMRPVVSMLGTPQYGLAKMLDSWIKPFIPNNYTLQSTEDFLEKLRDFTPSADDYCVSFDVTSLFTNVPLEETIQLIADFIYADKRRILYQIKKDIFIKLLRLATKGTFLYRDLLYKQIDGVSMGSCLAPTLANFFLGHLETILFQKFNEFYPKFYRRYVDDIFCVFKKETDYTHFLQVLNSLHPNLNFTVDVGTNKLPFLDVQVELKENGFNSWVYRKPTHTNVMLNFMSNVPNQWKSGLIYCLLNRAYSICSSIVYFEQEVQLLKKMFSANGYPASFFDNALTHFLSRVGDNGGLVARPSQSPVAGRDADVDQERFVVFRMPYFGLPSKIFAKKFSTLIESSFGVRVRVVYTSLKVQSFFRLKSVTPPSLLSCVVYKFDCVSNPELSYIGQTHRHIDVRAGEHLADKGETGVGAHVKSCPDCSKSTLGLNNFQVVKKCRNDFDAKIFESFLIQKLQPKLNTQLYRQGTGFLLKVFK